jgi:hypothetical protein
MMVLILLFLVTVVASAAAAVVVVVVVKKKKNVHIGVSITPVLFYSVTSRQTQATRNRISISLCMTGN